MARFTAANARQMAAKSHAARLQRHASRDVAAENSPQEPQAGPQEPPGSYLSRRLSRVRAQLDLVDTAIEREASKANPDGQHLNWLAAAQERLAEQERLLSDRPLPGSRRPRETSRQVTAWPLFEHIEPTVALPTLAAPEPTLIEPQHPVPQVPHGSPDSLPVKPPTPAPTVAPTPRSAPGVGPVPIAVAIALGRRPAPLPTPTSPAPPTPPTTRAVVTTATAAMKPSVPTVYPNPKPPGGGYGRPPSLPA
jgi:hypothetical protein